MIPPKAPPSQAIDWRRDCREALSEPAELDRRLALRAETASGEASARFPLRAPEPFLSRVRPGDPDDPLLRQVLPSDAELEEAEGFVRDPVGDLQVATGGGLLQKYRGRALLIATGACPIHCRYCFRRHFPYGEQATADPTELAATLRTMPDVQELILSGGDPLMLSDARLGALIAAAESVPHLRRLRIHTRMPVAVPARITDALCRHLGTGRLRPVVVVHCNHPDEIDDEVRGALARLASAGVTLLNQSVLLRGVNDDADTLVRLSETLFAAGVLPYYLHLLDRAAGTAHFEVPESEAREIHRRCSARLPGYLLPRLARETAGEPGKRVLC